jgi:four helix bundle protein
MRLLSVLWSSFPQFEFRIQIAECRIARMKTSDLKLRTKQFALQVIKFCENLPRDDTSKTLGRQLLRSGTSVGANYRAVCRAKSTADFISKFGPVLEEADESAFWIELLIDSSKAKVDKAGLAAERGQRVGRHFNLIHKHSPKEHPFLKSKSF